MVPAGAHAGTNAELSVGYFSSADSQGFLGYVNSSEKACETGRVVSVFKKRAGEDPLMGKDRSEREGEYGIYQFDVDKVKRDATYYAKTPARPGCAKVRSENYYLCAPSRMTAARDCRAAPTRD